MRTSIPGMRCAPSGLHFRQTFANKIVEFAKLQELHRRISAVVSHPSTGAYADGVVAVFAGSHHLTFTFNAPPFPITHHPSPNCNAPSRSQLFGMMASSVPGGDGATGVSDQGRENAAHPGAHAISITRAASFDPARARILIDIPWLQS
jgi:hypothetical protein